MENGMEWKEKFGSITGNMEDVQNGMEGLKNEMEDRLPYLPNSKFHILKLITNQKLNVMHLPIHKK